MLRFADTEGLDPTCLGGTVHKSEGCTEVGLRKYGRLEGKGFQLDHLGWTRSGKVAARFLSVNAPKAIARWQACSRGAS